MSETILILEGRGAAAWLAGAGNNIGLASPALYRQNISGDEIYKLNNEVLLVTGSNITEIIENNWQAGAPDNVVLHRPDSGQQRRLCGFFTNDS